jgi:hypothetical protein
MCPRSARHTGGTGPQPGRPGPAAAGSAVSLGSSSTAGRQRTGPRCTPSVWIWGGPSASRRAAPRWHGRRMRACWASRMPGLPLDPAYGGLAQAAGGRADQFLALSPGSRVERRVGHRCLLTARGACVSASRTHVPRYRQARHTRRGRTRWRLTDGQARL